MILDCYQIDAFTDHVFGGNPACVVPLEEWLDDSILLKIAKENAVAETAYFVKKGDVFHLRWFTPDIEMDLCGHATLATAHCLKEILGYQADKILFDTLSGRLEVLFDAARYVLNFPSRKPKLAHLPEMIQKAFNIQPHSVLKARDYIMVYEDEAAIKDSVIDLSYFNQINLDTGCVVITSKGSDCDFVSRVFTPQSTFLEDPVTGSTHCSLIPYWSEQLGKTELFARQLSDRGGTLYCKDAGDKVIIAGNAVTYSKGHLFL